VYQESPARGGDVESSEKSADVCSPVSSFEGAVTDEEIDRLYAACLRVCEEVGLQQIATPSAAGLAEARD
jgi:hypothetical protein